MKMKIRWGIVAMMSSSSNGKVAMCCADEGRGLMFNTSYLFS